MYLSSERRCMETMCKGASVSPGEDILVFFVVVVKIKLKFEGKLQIYI